MVKADGVIDQRTIYRNSPIKQFMANYVSDSDETSKNAFDFYNTYLSVIYGLLATQGLTSVVTFTSKDDENAWNVVSILLFAGTFITAMRLWLSLANIDDVTRRSYGVVASLHHSWFNLLLLVDTAFATAFAGLLLAMFSAIPSETSWFRLFLWLSGLTLLYDLVSGLIFYRFAKQVDGEADDHEVIRRYKGKMRKWIKQDLAFGAAVAALYIVDTSLHLDSSVTLASTFVLLAVVLSVVELFPHWVDMIRKFLGGSRAQA